jgi:aspartyl/asparaginyl-tRNA synthetase
MSLKLTILFVKLFEGHGFQDGKVLSLRWLKGLRNYFEKEGFVGIVVPHVTKATGACENISTLFELNYCDGDVR